MVGKGGSADADGGDGQMEAAAGPLLRPGNEVRGQTALLRGLLNNGAVIAGDPQTGGQALANQTAAAAELTADGNHIVAHGIPPALSGILPRLPGWQRRGWILFYIIAETEENDNENLHSAALGGKKTEGREKSGEE